MHSSATYSCSAELLTQRATSCRCWPGCNKEGQRKHGVRSVGVQALVLGDSQSFMMRHFTVPLGSNLTVWFAWQPGILHGVAAAHPRCAMWELEGAANVRLWSGWMDQKIHPAAELPEAQWAAGSSHCLAAVCQKAGAALGLLVCVWFGGMLAALWLYWQKAA